jgi:hypothetical protein
MGPTTTLNRTNNMRTKKTRFASDGTSAPADYFPPTTPLPPGEVNTLKQAADVGTYGAASHVAPLPSGDGPTLEYNSLRFSSASVLATLGVPGPGDIKMFGIVPFHSGAYLLPVGTAGGKTTLLSGLTAWINQQQGCGASLLYVFEPRYTAQSPLWLNPSQFLVDLETSLAGNANQGGGASAIASLSVSSAATGGSIQNKLLCIDSITQALLAYQIPGTTKQPGTQEGGFDPSWLTFAMELNRIATKYDIVIIGAINTSELPVYAGMIGALEGAMTLIDVATFQLQDRSSRLAPGSTPVVYSIPVPIVNSILHEFGYGDYIPSGSASSALNFTPRFVGVQP